MAYTFANLIADLALHQLPERWCQKFYDDRLLLYHINENSVTTTLIIYPDLFPELMIQKQDCVLTLLLMDLESFDGFFDYLTELRRASFCRDILLLNQRRHPHCQRIFFLDVSCLEHYLNDSFTMQCVKCQRMQQRERERTSQINQRKKVSLRIRRNLHRVRPLLESLEEKVLVLQNVIQTLLRQHATVLSEQEQQQQQRRQQRQLPPPPQQQQQQSPPPPQQQQQQQRRRRRRRRQEPQQQQQQ